MRGLKINKKWFNIATWSCKFDGSKKGICGCCEPKNVLHPIAASYPMFREYFRPNETGKTKTPRRR